MISFLGVVVAMLKTQFRPAATTMDCTMTTGGWQISQDSLSLTRLWLTVLPWLLLSSTMSTVTQMPTWQENSKAFLLPKIRLMTTLTLKCETSKKLN